MACHRHEGRLLEQGREGTEKKNCFRNRSKLLSVSRDMAVQTGKLGILAGAGKSSKSHHLMYIQKKMK